MNSNILDMSESECDYEEEVRDEVIEPIRFYSTEIVRQKQKQLKKTFSANFATLINSKDTQFKQLDKFLKESTYNNKKPISQLKVLKKNQQKRFLVFLLNSTENISLQLSQECQASCQISDLIMILIQRFNEQLDNYQLIKDFKLYQLVEATEDGEKHSLGYPYEYEAKVSEIEAKHIKLEPRTKNYIFYPQTQENKHIAYRNSSAIDYYSNGINSFLDEEQTRTYSTDLPETENHTFSFVKQIKQSKVKPIQKFRKDQPNHEVSSCNIFSFFSFFKTKKAQAK